jgi:hypothetical protein
VVAVLEFNCSRTHEHKFLTRVGPEWDRRDRQG